MEGKESIGIVDELPETKKVLVAGDSGPRLLTTVDRLRALIAMSQLAGLPVSDQLVNAERIISSNGKPGYCKCGERISYNKYQCLACKGKG